MKNLTARKRHSNSEEQHQHGALPPPQSQAPSGTITATPPNSGVVLARRWFRLVARDIHGTSGNVFLDLTKEIVIGTLCGVLFILFLSFLDYRNILPNRSGGRLRSAAYELVSDPEWMHTIEENIDVRFLDMDIFDAMKNEISNMPGKLDDYEEFQKKVKELEAEKQKLEKATAEVNDLIAKLGVNTDKWCGGCKGGWGNCEGRKRYIVENYHTSEKKAMVDIMLQGKCILPD